MAYLTAPECREIVKNHRLLDYIDSIRKNLSASNQSYKFDYPTNARAAFVESHFVFDQLQLSFGMNVGSEPPNKDIYVEISAIKKNAQSRLQLQALCNRHMGMFTRIKEGQRDYVSLADFTSLMSDEAQIARAVAQAYKLIVS